MTTESIGIDQLQYTYLLLIRGTRNYRPRLLKFVLSKGAELLTNFTVLGVMAASFTRQLVEEASPFITNSSRIVEVQLKEFLNVRHVTTS